MVRTNLRRSVAIRNSAPGLPRGRGSAVAAASSHGTKQCSMSVGSPDRPNLHVVSATPTGLSGAPRVRRGQPRGQTIHKIAASLGAPGSSPLERDPVHVDWQIVMGSRQRVHALVIPSTLELAGRRARAARDPEDRESTVAGLVDDFKVHSQYLELSHQRPIGRNESVAI